MTERLDCVVAGAGVIGLAIARALSMHGHEVVVLEAEASIGAHASSRNSEVIHAGIYYPPGTLKAKLCVEGKALLYRYCVERGIEHRQIGKLIVATAEHEIASLYALHDRAIGNGVHDLRMLNGAELQSLEPRLQAEAALFSPSTGIIDTDALLWSLQADIEASGGTVLVNHRVAGLSKKDHHFAFDAAGESIRCKTFINAAGLGAAQLFSQCASLRQAQRDNGPTQNDDQGFSAPSVKLAKGHYFAYQGQSPFRHLIYPLPSGGGLGIHATNDLSGALRFGPDVEWVEAIDYSFDESRKRSFVDAIRCYFPTLDEARLEPAYTGIRAKLEGSGVTEADFVIAGKEAHGVRGLVNLFGIDSPGLTSSLAIGEYVASIAE